METIAATSPPIPLDPLAERLRSDDANSTSGGGMLVVGGVALCVLTATLFSLLLCLLLWLWFDTFGLGFWGWWIIAMIGLAAIVVLRLCAKQGGNYFVPGVGAEHALNIRYIDSLLIGPRMLIVGIRQSQGDDAGLRQNFFDRCALLLRQLAAAGEAQPAAELLIGGDETPEMLNKVLDYLYRRNWAGHSSDYSRVWLSSTAKVQLPQLGVIINAR